MQFIKMQFINTIFGIPLGWIMWACFKVVPMYGIALILFTLITKALLFPLSVKQKKASAKMAIFQPKINEIQKKYKDKEKQQEAMMKLYEEEGYNPMSSCLPLLIQFPILFGLIDVIYKPLTHLLRFPKEILAQINEVATGLGINVTMYQSQISIVGEFHKNPEAFAAIAPEYLAKLSSLNLTFLGLDFTATPKLSLWLDGTQASGLNWLILLPILSGVAALVQSLYSMKANQVPGQPQAGGGSMKIMMYIMPLFSVFIAFSFPAALSFYWTLSSVIALVQDMVLNKFYNPTRMIEIAEKEKEERKEKRKKLREQAAVYKAYKSGGTLPSGDAEVAKPEELTEEGLTKKELDRKRLAEARKRDAEKYGEVYVDVTDEDLK